MRFFKSLYYYLYFKIIGARIKDVLAPYLTDKSKIHISYLFQKIIITKYNLKLLKEQEVVIDYLNKVISSMKFDKIEFRSNRVVISSEKIPATYNPKEKDNRLFQLTIGQTEDGSYKIQTNINHCILFAMGPGSGKTFALDKTLSTILKYHYSPTDKTKTFQEIIIIDPKNEGDFDKYLNVANIINTQEQAHEFLTRLNLAVEDNTNKRTLVIIEEYTQLILNGDKKLAKEIAKLIQRINTFYRSKGVVLIMTTQFLTAEMNEIAIDSFVKVISSPTKAYAQLYGIPTIYCNRPDFIHGKFLINCRGTTKCIRI